MIKRLQVRNYKSLKDIDVDLRQMNVLVGPNMSGKSNLIDCLKFLTEICFFGPATAFQKRGGFLEVYWKGEGSGPICLRLVVELSLNDQGLSKYDYEISISDSGSSSPPGLFSVAREHLAVTSEGNAITLIDFKNGHGTASNENGSMAFEFSDPSKSALEFSVPGWDGNKFKDYVSSWRYYQLEPAKMKQPNPATGQPSLAGDGSNFSSWLMTLQTGHPDEFRMIKQATKDVLPDLEEILAPPTQFGTTYVTTREKHLRGPIGIDHMSVGEIVFLAWLSLIYAPRSLSAPLFCIEEIENHLHPKMIETLVEVLTQRQSELGSEATQILASTHSLYFVDRVRLEDLVVVERTAGATRCTRPASKAHLRELLESEELGLGELWYSGVLGG